MPLQLSQDVDESFIHRCEGLLAPRATLLQRVDLPREFLRAVVVLEVGVEVLAW